MCKMMEDMRRKVARETAWLERTQFAKKLLQSENFSYEKIAEYSNLTLIEVKELANEIGK